MRRHLSKGMARAAVVISMIAAAPVFADGGGPVNGRKVIAGPDARPERIPLYLSSDRAIVMVRIGDHAPFPVVFDTGASGNAIDLGLADRLGLPNTGPSDGVDGQGTPIPGHRTRLTGVRMGGVALPPIDALASAYHLPDEVGILGSNAFTGRLVKVDFAASSLTLSARTAANTPQCVAFAYSHDFSFDSDKTDTLPTARMTVGTATIDAEIDTGNNSGLILPLSYAAKLPLEAPPVADGYGQSQASREEIRAARIDGDVTIAGVTLHHPDVLFMAAHKPNIGLRVLRRFTIVLDPAGQRDWLIPAGNDAITCRPPLPVK